MSAPDWGLVSTLFEQALAQPADARGAWLRSTGHDDTVLAEVEDLLRSYEAEPEFLEAPADVGAAVQALDGRGGGPDAEPSIGPYRLIRELGRGGMGVVYEAQDTRFDRRVALKVLPAVWSASSLVERFHLERRLLATLDHPNIARLLDGGTTEDGIPYFVMEFVEGEPIDRWCATRALTIRDRVTLLQAVCDAVAHAHQHLIVHRDLKPANILVAADGRPRLLDFGIATLVSAESGISAGLTRTGQSSFTPEYASPEQVRGEPVTTATDVYSLGVLMYRLLSGRLPYQLDGRSPLQVMSAICEQEPEAPSRVAAPTEARLLRGDLDTIVLKALRKDPRERYATVFGVADDLAAWAQGRPVSAVPATRGYRLRKFASRHRAAIVASAAIVLTLVGGAITTAWQARVARQERDKAENRFREVREFSRSLLFEVHDALRTLPGATEPRRLLLARAVQFLDRLATDVGNDDALRLELAEGYRRLGQVQGSGLSENLGDAAAAVASFEKAVALAEEVLGRRPDWLEAANVATGAYDDLSTALLSRGRTDEAERAYARHHALVQDMERRYPSDPAGRASMAASYVNLGLFRAARRDLPAARGLYEQAIDIFDALPAEHHDADEVTRSHAFALKRLGAIQLADGQIEAGERRYRDALALDEALVSRHPDDARYRYDMTFTLSDLGFAAAKRGDPTAAIALWTRALEIREAAVTADAKDVRAMVGVANLHQNLADATRQLHRFDEAVGHFRALVRMREAIVVQQGSTPATRLARAEAQTRLAGCLLDAVGASPGRVGDQRLVEVRALLAAAELDAGPLAGRNPTAKAIQGQIAIDRARLARF